MVDSLWLAIDHLDSMRIAINRTEYQGGSHGVVVGPGQGGDANVAEFGALIHGLTWLADNAAEQIRSCGLAVEGDSRLVIETVAGRWKLSSAKLIPLRDRAQALVQALGGPDNVTLTKVGRERNVAADELTRLAYHEAKAGLAGADSKAK